MFDTSKKTTSRVAKTGSGRTQSNSGKTKADGGQPKSKEKKVVAFTKRVGETTRPHFLTRHGDAKKREEIEMFHVARHAVPLTDQPVDQHPHSPIDSDLEWDAHEKETNLLTGEMLPSIRELLATSPAIVNDMRGQFVEWQYNAGRDINITNVQSWDGLAAQMDKIQAQIAKASTHQVMSVERATAIQTQLANISIEMRQHDRNKQAIMAGLAKAQSQVSTASMELAQKIEQCTLEIERLQHQLEQVKSADPQTTAEDERAYQMLQAGRKLTSRRGVLLTSMAGLVALAFDLGLTGGLVSALPALMVVGQSAWTLFTNSQTTVACPACGSQFQAG